MRVGLSAAANIPCTPAFMAAYPGVTWCIPTSTGPNIVGLTTSQIATAGLQAGQYTFTDGLSDDPNLPPYLQNLTATQLQAAFAGQVPGVTDMTGCVQYSDGSLQCPVTSIASCSSPDADPSVCGTSGTGGLSLTTMLLLASLGVIAALALEGR